MTKAKFINDWQSLSAKQEPAGSKKKFDNEKVVEPYRVKRRGSFLTMYPSDAGEEYAFSIVPSSDGKSFIMTEVMVVKRFNFKNPKTNEDYFETLKIPMDPKLLFDMSVVDKAAKTPEKLSDKEKKTLEDIKRHASLTKRFKDLYWDKTEGVNLKYAKNPTRYNQRIQKDALTGFFGIKTKWKGVNNEEKDYSVKFISTKYVGFQEKFRTLLQQMSSSHDDLMPDWYEKYFSTLKGVNGVIDVEMGSMRVGGKGATVRLVKLGKDPIEDASVGVSGVIDPKSITTLQGKENELKHLHYYMGFNSQESLWQDMYVDRFEEAIVDLENHVKEVQEKNEAEAKKEESSVSSN